MSQSDALARLAEAVSGLEQAISGIPAILEGQGEPLARLLKAAEEEPPEEIETLPLLKALIGRVDQQQGTLQGIEKGIEALAGVWRSQRDSREDDFRLDEPKQLMELYR